MAAERDDAHDADVTVRKDPGCVPNFNIVVKFLQANSAARPSIVHNCVETVVRSASQVLLILTLWSASASAHAMVGARLPYAL